MTLLVLKKTVSSEADNRYQPESWKLDVCLMMSISSLYMRSLVCMNDALFVDARMKMGIPVMENLAVIHLTLRRGSRERCADFYG